jgi:hypothetical protein
MNPELIMNPYIAPVYVTTTNMILPLATISYEAFYESFLNSLNFLWSILTITAFTAQFIVVEGVKTFVEETNLFEKFLFGLGVINLILLTTYDNTNKSERETTLQILESHEINLSQLKKQERMREDWEQLWSEEIKISHQENEKKLAEMKKQLDGLVKDQIQLMKRMKAAEKEIKQFD